jgi:selenocysteine lyase/cysteine desulfurase
LAGRVARELAERGGIGVRSGCHCAHLLIKHLLHIHPLQALLQGVIVSLFPQVLLPGLTRVSLGIENGFEDVETLVAVLGRIARQPRAEVENSFVSRSRLVQKQTDDFARAVAQKVLAV